LLLGRVLMAFIFVQSGFGKLLHMGGFSASLASKGVPLADVFGVVGPCVEFFGGLAVLLGVQTRYAAGLIAVFTVVATAISHRYWEFSDAARRAQEVNFSKNICIFGGFLLLMATGGGRFSLDGLLRGGSLKAPAVMGWSSMRRADSGSRAKPVYGGKHDVWNFENLHRLHSMTREEPASRHDRRA
jgi:putative oxidoreductase